MKRIRWFYDKNEGLTGIGVTFFVVLPFMLMCILTGCDQTMARSFGGDMTIELEPGEKLEMITWKDDVSLWYLTRPMTEDDIAETHVFRESSELGVLEGTVTIIETKE